MGTITQRRAWKPSTRGPGPRALLFASLVGILLVWAIQVDLMDLSRQRALRQVVGHVAALLLAAGAAWAGYTLATPWMGVVVTVLLPIALVPPTAWTWTTPITALDACCLPRGIALFAGIASILGAGAARMRPELAGLPDAERPRRPLILGAILVSLAVVVFALASLPGGTLGSQGEPLTGGWLPAVLAFVGCAAWGWGFPRFWPAGYLVLAGLLVLVPDPRPLLVTDLGWSGLLAAFSMLLVPALGYLCGAAARRVVYRGATAA